MYLKASRAGQARRFSVGNGGRSAAPSVRSVSLTSALTAARHGFAETRALSGGEDAVGLVRRGAWTSDTARVLSAQWFAGAPRLCFSASGRPRFTVKPERSYGMC